MTYVRCLISLSLSPWLCCDLWVCQDLVYCGNCPGSGDNDEGWECKHRKSGPGASTDNKTQDNLNLNLTHHKLNICCRSSSSRGRVICSPSGQVSSLMRVRQMAVMESWRVIHPLAPQSHLAVLSRGPSPHLLLSHNLSQPSALIGPGAPLWHQSNPHCRGNVKYGMLMFYLERTGLC